MTKLWSVVLVAMLAFVHLDADAKRMGGGKSMGQQSGNVTQRQATPAQAPGNNATAPAQAQRPATPNAAPAAPKKPWGAMLGGLAAGLGLAWLAHSLGFGEAFANMLLIGLAIMAVLAIVGFVMRRKSAAAQQPAQSPFAFRVLAMQRRKRRYRPLLRPSTTPRKSATTPRPALGNKVQHRWQLLQVAA